MTAQLLFEEKEGAWEGALLLDGQLYAYQKETASIAAEQIYLCKTDRMIKGMEAAFVKLTPRDNGFLPYAEMRNTSAVPPRSGEKFLVQVKKPPVQQKCAYVTCDITLAGKYCILMPMSDHCSVSRRIADEDQKTRLEQLGKSIKPANMGLILREESATAALSDIQQELQALLLRWQRIQEQASAASAPCLIDGGLSLCERMLRDVRSPLCEIITNRPEAFMHSAVPVRTAPSPMTLYNVQGKLEKSLRRKVWLNCGGNLIIDPCEAMTVIDVNSAKDLGSKKGAEDTITRLNCEAALEIARLMRLRSMGGIILVDFVDMQKEENRAEVLRTMQEALHDDPVKTVIHGFTALGILEITRKKTSEQLSLPSSYQPSPTEAEHE